MKFKFETAFDALVIGMLAGSLWNLSDWRYWAAITAWVVPSTICRYFDKQRES